MSAIESDRATALYELRYQQSFLGGKVDVKIGQQSADQEFMVTQYGGLFLNSSFGWTALPSADLPASGPSYPLAGLGVFNPGGGILDPNQPTKRIGHAAILGLRTSVTF